MNFDGTRVTKPLPMPFEVFFATLVAHCIPLAHPFQIDFFFFSINTLFGNHIYVLALDAGGRLHVIPILDTVTSEANGALPIDAAGFEISVDSGHMSWFVLFALPADLPVQRVEVKKTAARANPLGGRKGVFGRFEFRQVHFC